MDTKNSREASAQTPGTRFLGDAVGRPTRNVTGLHAGERGLPVAPPDGAEDRRCSSFKKAGGMTVLNRVLTGIERFELVKCRGVFAQPPRSQACRRSGTTPALSLSGWRHSSLGYRHKDRQARGDLEPESFLDHKHIFQKAGKASIFLILFLHQNCVTPPEG